MTWAWDGAKLLIDGEEMARVSVRPDGAMVKLYESPEEFDHRVDGPFCSTAEAKTHAEKHFGLS